VENSGIGKRASWRCEHRLAAGAHPIMPMQYQYQLKSEEGYRERETLLLLMSWQA